MNGNLVLIEVISRILFISVINEKLLRKGRVSAGDLIKERLRERMQLASASHRGQGRKGRQSERNSRG